MAEEQFISDLSVGVALAALLILALAFRNYRVDSVRDELFALRDEMFLCAYDNELTDSVGYMHLRSLMNGLIRYSHHLSFSRLLVLATWNRVATGNLSPPKAFVEWMSAIDQLPDHQKQQLRMFHAKAEFLIEKHLFTGSILLLIVSIPIALRLFFAHGKKLLTEKTADALRGVVPPIGLFEAEALKTVVPAPA